MIKHTGAQRALQKSPEKSPQKSRFKAGDTIKNILIAVLVISAVYLGWSSRLFGNEAESLAAVFKPITGTPSTGSGDENTMPAAGLPVTVAVTDGAGGRYGVKYDLDEIERLYSKTVAVFSQALGSARTPAETTAEEWQDALESLGIYYEYVTPVRLAILAGWFGTDIAGDWGDISVRRLCVIDSGGIIKLYFQDDATGDLYVSVTAASDDLARRQEGFGMNSAVFAFKVWEKSAAPYTLLLMDVTEYPVMTAKNPLNDEKVRADILLSLGVNGDTTPSFPEQEGEVFVEETFNLRVLRNGTIIYHWTGNEESGGPMRESDAIALAYQKVSETVGDSDYCGHDTAVYYDSGKELADGGYQVFFRYIAAGGAVWLTPDGYAAAVTVKDGKIVEAVFNFRTFEALPFDALEEPVVLLPELQAAAATDCDFMLGFDDNGSGILTPAWVRLPLNP